MNKKPAIGLMTYAIDNRSAKGTALYAVKLIEQLLEHRDEFEFVFMHFEKNDHAIYSHGVREVIFPTLPWPLNRRSLRQLFYFLTTKDSFDIIHWFQPRLYPFFWLAPTKKIVVTAHGAGDITTANTFVFSRSIFNFVMRHFNRKIDAIVADSQFAKGEIVEQYRVAPERVYVTYLGGGENYHALDKSASQTVISRNYQIVPPFILDIARLTHHKNIDTLLKAYDLFRAGGRHEHLILVGGDAGPQSAALRTLAAASPYARDIRIIEYVAQQDLNALYSAAELFVFPSRNEGFGLPVVEAFASGVPVVTSNVTSLPEIAGDAALTIDPEDARALADAMVRVLSDDGLRVALIEKGKERSRQFVWQKTAAQTLGLYRMFLT